MRKVSGDICVVGAGTAGASAAIEAARLGRKVILVDGMPALGGQAVNSIIGTFCGLFSNGTHGYQFTHGIADDILRRRSARTATSSITATARSRPSSTTTRSRSAAGSSARCATLGITGDRRRGGARGRRRGPPHQEAASRHALRRRRGRGDRLRRRQRRCRAGLPGGLCLPRAGRARSTARRW